MTRRTASHLALLGLALSLPACAPEFAPPSELNSLRVMAVQKDKPYARPGDEVQLQMLWHDASGEPSREIQIQWLAGCYNPQGDLFRACFLDSDFSALSSNARVTAAQVTSDGGADASAPAPSADAGVMPSGTDAGPVAGDAGAPPEDAPTLSIPFDEQVLGGGDFQVKVGYGERFSFRMPEQIVSSRPRAPNDPSPPYGMAYVFFAICAGELRLEESEEFPLACYDGAERLGSRDFVAGYTAVYAYGDAGISNVNPRIDGLMINGEDAEADCIGDACSGLISPASDEAGSCDEAHTFRWCPDEKHCDRIAIKPVIDQSNPPERDDVLAATRGSQLSEQAWINYYVDRGTFSRDLRLLSDAVTGWAPDYGGEFKPTQLGTAHLWAVAHDNRGGTDWLRTTVCIEP